MNIFKVAIILSFFMLADEVNGCSECVDFIEDYRGDADGAKEQCKVIFSSKDDRTMCRKVAGAVLNKGKNVFYKCRVSGWCTTLSPSEVPSGAPSLLPSSEPSGAPSGQPSLEPTRDPASPPTASPTNNPTSRPTETRPGGEDDCSECLDFLEEYEGKPWRAKKKCEKIHSKKKDRQMCKNVVDAVMKRGKNAQYKCKASGWCKMAPTGAPVSSPTANPTEDRSGEEEECPACVAFFNQFKGKKDYPKAKNKCKKKFGTMSGKKTRKACEDVAKDVLKEGKTPTDKYCKENRWC